MIIECQACRTRFRLDESKITGKGARIRCRRCSEAIIVMKSDIPPPAVSPPAGKELFDLRAVLQEPEKKIPVPPRNEVDTAFNGILDQDRETGRIP
ncbi:MAG: zinc-ribbon domain-containing protein, partial [Candidatus Deferrimicrobiaceae bacterium]